MAVGQKSEVERKETKWSQKSEDGSQKLKEKETKWSRKSDFELIRYEYFYYNLLLPV